MTTTATSPVETAEQQYQRQRIAHWDALAARRGSTGSGYHRRIAQVYRFLIPPGLRVLELGCAEGHLLAGVQPGVGVGVDFSPGMLAIARQRHPELRLIAGDAHNLALDEKFDVIIMSDLVNDLWDVQGVLVRVAGLCTERTRLVFNFYSRVWQVPLGVARRVGLARRELPQNWLTPGDLENLLYLTGFETIRRWREVLWPVRTPGLDALANRVLTRCWPLEHLALTNFLLARPRPRPRPRPPVLPVGGPRDQTQPGPAQPDAAVPDKPPRVSVVVPARNEAGNIATILARTPEFPGGTELIFVEGHSHDDTWGEVLRQIAAHPARPGFRSVAFQQVGKGKGDAVRLGFARATGDILIILDADLTVPPEDLPRFVDALDQGLGEFVNGVRLVYPMERRAMRFLNLVANKSFSAAFSWVLGQPIKDTLCGTKALYARDYQVLADNRAYFGDFDPFGDFDLIFGAARLNLKIVDIPIRYRERTYGTTNIQRWRHGWLLLKMLGFAARRLKFR